MSLRGSLVHGLSKFLANRPATMFAVQRGWLNFTYKAMDLSNASWVIWRPEWLRVPSKLTPTALEPALQDRPIDLPLAERLIEQYKTGLADAADKDIAIPEDSIWGVLRQEHYSEFCTLIAAGDAQALGEYQARLFRTATVNGYTYGSTFDDRPHRWAYLPINIELSAVTLAECLGVLRAEQQEQGEIAYWRAQHSEESLIAELEERLGVRIESPRIGDPHGVMFGGRFLTRETCAHLYSAHRMREIFDRQGLDGQLNIVEIGAGFGGTCYWLHKLLGKRIGRYVIVDLPEVGLVQATFLGSTYPESLVLQGEPMDKVTSPIQLIPHFRLEDIDFKPNVLINQDSMPEMPQSEVERYIGWADRNLDGLFLSFNQEAYSPQAGIPQVLVPSVVSTFPRFKRLARETSWNRRGYVEEVYEARSQ